jgi:glucose-6-phosphate 1-epimerase
MLSRKSAFQSDKPIRGGIPICWPWFGPRENDPASPIHGFARLADWDLDSVTPKGDAVELTLSIHDTPATLKIWPHPFRLRYTLTVGPALTLSLETTNTGPQPFTFTEALHPYFAVSDVRNIHLTGLENTPFSERIYQPETQQQGPSPIRFTRRTDRVYYDTTTPLTIHDPGLDRKITQTKGNSHTTVVWNPWNEWPKTVPDFAEDEWPSMVCVEPSNAHHRSITLQPTQSHTLRATIEIEKA